MQLHALCAMGFGAEAIPAKATTRFFFRQRRKEAVMANWHKISALPKHAPLNAVYRQPTGYRSFLGGYIWAWADAQGQYLGESNAVPVNMCGETTKPGEKVEPGEVVIGPEEIAELEGKPVQYWIVRGKPWVSLGQTLSVSIFSSRISEPSPETEVFSGPFLSYDEASSRRMLKSIQEGEAPQLESCRKYLEEKWAV